MSATTSAGTPVACRHCGAELARKWPSGYIRYLARVVEKDPNGRVKLQCAGCQREIRLRL